MKYRQAKKNKKLKKAIQANNRINDWLPILEADRDWDYTFLEYILAFKLKRMAKVIGEDKNLLYAKRTGRSIQYAVYLLDRIHSRVDEIKFNDEFREKWGNIKIEFVNLEGNKFKIMKSTYTKAKTPEEHEQAEADSRENYNMAAKKIDELYARLFRHMGKYWRRWWS